jgi:hypothetical protein
MKINNNLNLTQYTVAGFARGLTPVEIKNIQEDTINRHTSAAATYQRIAKIKVCLTCSTSQLFSIIYYIFIF